MMSNEEAIVQLMYIKDFKTPQQIEALDMAIKALQEQKVGEWEEIKVISNAYDVAGVKTWVSLMGCNKCDFRTFAIEGHFAQYNYCPSCGAKMIERRIKHED